MPRHIRLKEHGFTTVRYTIVGVAVVVVLLVGAIFAFNGDSASKQKGSTPASLINETAKCLVNDGPCKLDPSISFTHFYTYALSFNLSTLDTSGHLLVLKQRGAEAYRFCYHPESLPLLEPCPHDWLEMAASGIPDSFGWFTEPPEEPLTMSID